MSSITTPGFTAEAACYQGGAPYRVGSAAPVRGQGDEVIPARNMIMHVPGFGLLFGNEFVTCFWDYNSGQVSCDTIQV